MFSSEDTYAIVTLHAPTTAPSSATQEGRREVGEVSVGVSNDGRLCREGGGKEWEEGSMERGGNGKGRG